MAVPGLHSCAALVVAIAVTAAAVPRGKGLVRGGVLPARARPRPIQAYFFL